MWCRACKVEDVFSVLWSWLSSMAMGRDMCHYGQLFNFTHHRVVSFNLEDGGVVNITQEKLSNYANDLIVGHNHLYDFAAPDIHALGGVIMWRIYLDMNDIWKCRP